jgi:hypothetical protein
VKDIVAAELARFPRAGEIDQLRKEFAEPKSLNPRGKWQADQTYNKLDLVTINGDSYTSNIDGNRTRPSRSSADWTLVAARGTGGGGGPTSLSELTTVPSNGDILIGSGTSWVTSNLTAGAGISITVAAGEITISATDGDITLDDGTAASPSLHFTNDADTGLYRPAANTLGISVSGTQVAYFDEDGLTIPNAGVVAGGSFHGANGNANNPSFSFTSDQDTGFYRHGTNELGISIGGTEKAVMTSTTFSITPNVSTSGNLTVSGTGGITSSSVSPLLKATTTALGAVPKLTLENTNNGAWNVYLSATDGGDFKIDQDSTNKFRLAFGTGNATLAGNLTVSGQASGTTGSINVANGTLTGITSYASGASLDQKYWSWQAGSAVGDGVYRLRALNDAGTNGINAISISRSGISSVELTLGGNLTISGTGETSTLGYLRVGTNTGGGTSQGTFNFGQLADDRCFRGGYRSGTLNRFEIQGTNGNGSAFATLGIEGTTLVVNAVTGGNVLLGKTIDSSNGKLQLADHTGSYGGIGLGTDTSLYRAATGDIYFSNSSGYQVIRLQSAGTNQSSYIDLRPTGTGSGIIQVSGTTALTLDSSSQNATFAGKVTVSGGSFSAASFYKSASLGTVLSGATGSSYDLFVTNPAGSYIMQTPTGTRNVEFAGTLSTVGNATFGGTIAIGNTVAAAAGVSSTHKVTISIGGSTYYLLATNV